MTERETDVMRAVEALRVARSPSAAAKARVHARLEAALLGGPHGVDVSDGLDGTTLGAGAGVAEGVAPLGFVAKVVAATASLTAAGLVTLKLGAVAYQAWAAAPEPAPAAAVAVASAEGTGVTTASASEPGSPADSAARARPDGNARAAVADHTIIAARPASPSASPVSSSPRASDRPSPDPAAPSAAVSSDVLAAELALIDAARRASDPAAVIVQLGEHERRFPSGALRDERDALWAIASCARDDLDDARTRAEALAARRPSSPLLERIADACPKLAP